MDDKPKLADKIFFDIGCPCGDCDGVVITGDEDGEMIPCMELFQNAEQAKQSIIEHGFDPKEFPVVMVRVIPVNTFKKNDE